PDGDVSKLIQQSITDVQSDLGKTSDNFRFSAAVAEFGLLLRNSEYKQEASFEQVVALAKGARGRDEYGYRSEFFRLVESARSFAKR
ncbi:MAG TPA: YfbK domain-containing protein, partial [Chitinophagaceae bacterium]|nr:YfbK domain-containing protein [Chitinophagaceae bacterium]